MKTLPGCNRVEVIDHTRPYEHGGGRAFVIDPRARPANIKVSIDVQDEGRTLKVFIEPAEGTLRRDA
jgi:hypothetical protein